MAAVSKSIAAISTLLCGIALNPAVASATPTGFLDRLDDRGVEYRTIFGALDAGKGACTVMRTNSASAVESVTDAIDYVFYMTDVVPSRFYAVGIVNAAAHELCPDQLPKLYAHLNQP